MDERKIASVLLHWSLSSGGPWSEVVMNKISDRYEGRIPGQKPAVRVYYYISATDGFNTATSPAGAPANFYSFKVMEGELDVGGMCRAPAWVYRGTENVIMGKLLLFADGFTTITGVKIDKTGESSLNDLTRCKIYNDLSSNEAIDEGDPVLGTGSCNGGVINVTFGVPVELSESSASWLVVYDIAPNAIPGTRIGARLADSSYIKVSVGKVTNSAFPIAWKPMEIRGIPEVEVSPISLSATLPRDTTLTQVLTIRNNGDGDLCYKIIEEESGNLLEKFSFIKVRESRFINLSPVRIWRENNQRKIVGRIKAKAPPKLLDQGGPDSFGYYWKDSDEPGGPVYEWVEIANVGTKINLGDGDEENAGPFPIGFDFPFYGNTFNSFRVCTNGFVSFTSTSTLYKNIPIPNPTEPNNLLAVFWADLVVDSEAGVYYHNDGSRLIIQYDNVRHYDTEDRDTFEVILYPSGKIVYQYQSMEWYGRCVVGIENSDGTDGLQVFSHATSLHDELAIRFMHNFIPWISEKPEVGVIPPGSSVEVAITYNSAGLNEGVYHCNLVVEPNPWGPPTVTIPAKMVVEGSSLLPLLKPPPEESVLIGNRPNPFNPETWIEYGIGRGERVKVKVRIYNVLGQLVREMDLGMKEGRWYRARSHAIYWDGRDNQGQIVPGGIYFCQLIAGEKVMMRKMVILK
jgi:hypothetical protein